MKEYKPIKPKIHAAMKRTSIPNNGKPNNFAVMQKMSVSKSKDFMITGAIKKLSILGHENSKISTSIKKMNISTRKNSMFIDGIRNTSVQNGEKTNILTSGQDQKSNSLNQDLCTELEEESKLTAIIKKAHEDTCDLRKKKVALYEKARPQTNNSFSQLVCPLNTTTPYPINKDATYCKAELFERFFTEIQGVIEFAKRIPCFKALSQWDQDVLLKAGVFEVMLVRLACLFNTQDNSLFCFYGPFLHRDFVLADRDAGFFSKSILDFSKQMNDLNLSDNEIALLSSILLIAADHPGLRNPDVVLRMQNKLIRTLQRSVFSNHIENPGVFNDLMKIITVIRILNCLHSKKRMAYEMKPGIKDLPVTVCQVMDMLINVTLNGNENSSTRLDHQDNLPVSQPPKEVINLSVCQPPEEGSNLSVSQPPSEEGNNLPVCQPPSEERSNSPGQISSGSSTISYELSTIDYIDLEKLIRSPISVSEEDSNSSLKTSSFSSSESYEHEYSTPSETIQNVNLIHEIDLTLQCTSLATESPQVTAETSVSVKPHTGSGF